MIDRYEYAAPTMGTVMKLVVYAESESVAQRWIDACLIEIDRWIPILNNYSAQSEISQLNLKIREGDSQAIEISKELHLVLQHSKRWYELSSGVFDVTCGAIFELWKQARKTQRLPSQEERLAARERSGWHNLELSQNPPDANPKARYELKVHRPGMVLDVSGIATGCILDAAVERLTQAGCRCFLIDVGGDIRLGDAPPGKLGWVIQIAGLKKDSPPIMQLGLANCSLTTSGDRNQSYTIQGVAYSHLVDPRDGMPLSSSQSCTAIGATTTDADAAATALSILGRSQSAKLFQSLPLDQAILLYKSPGTQTDSNSETQFTRLTADTR